jgi:hypothetical protein
MATKRRLQPSPLLLWLNQDPVPAEIAYMGKPTKPSRLRVLSLVKAIDVATKALSEATALEPIRNYWTNPPKALNRAMNKVDDILAHYPSRPAVEISGQYGQGGLFFSHSLDGVGPLGERLAVSELLQLAEKKRLPFLQQCACQKWFLAKRPDQRACSPTCRHKKYEQTEAFKTKRREYMREYYALKNSGKVK